MKAGQTVDRELGPQGSVLDFAVGQALRPLRPWWVKPRNGVVGNRGLAQGSKLRTREKATQPLLELCSPREVRQTQ